MSLVDRHWVSLGEESKPWPCNLSGEPFARIEMDHYGPLSDSIRGNKYVLVVVDCFSKWVECIPVPDTEAKTTARALIEGWVCRYGVPNEIHCDQ